MEVKSFKEFSKIIKSGSLNGAFAIYGQEKYLINESIGIIYSKIKNFPELNIITLEGEGINKDSITNSFESMPFMCDSKIIHIKNPEFLKKTSRGQESEEKKPKGAYNDLVELLLSYINELPSDIILLITYDGEADDRNKLLLSIKNIGYKVEYKWLRGAELYEWIIERAAKEDKSISKTDASYLSAVVGSSMEKLDGEILKLCSYCKDEAVIKREHIDNVVSKSLENNIFKMADNISKKDAEGALSILNVLFFQREDFSKIIGMIIRQYRLMLTINLYKDKGINNEAIQSKLKLQRFAYDNISRLGRVYDNKALIEALNLCLETDYDIKRGRYPQEMGLEMLVVGLCR